MNNSLFFLLSFSIAEKETKKLDNKNLPARKARSTARFIVRPTLATEGAYINNTAFRYVRIDSDNLKRHLNKCFRNQNIQQLTTKAMNWLPITIGCL
jgi:hypothetical protein